MISLLIEAGKLLGRARSAAGDRVLDLAFRMLSSGPPPRRVPLSPDPLESTYWTPRATKLQPRDRYEKQY